MLALASNPGVQFLFSGGGPQRKSLQDIFERNQLSQVTFRAYCDRSQLGASLSEGHLGLVTQKPESAGAVVPSKVYAIMAAGRPLLYVGPHDATPAQIIQEFNCGWQVEAGDSEKLVDILTRLADRPTEIREAGERARRAFLDHFERQIGVARIVRILGAGNHRVAATA
jgi:glycosyltransferase involved in cell wall biosynthesis